ncbi:MAG TPA: ATP-binding protein [Ktedonobacteraceae bacterium]|nr:ATP-binding protein [Ktedonobacteraceae bacterium]
MLKILERKITLQLLVFYALFVIPLLLGGLELYFFQYNALQQSAQQADLALAQSIAQNVETQVHNVGQEAMELVHSQAVIQLNRLQMLSLFTVSKQIHPEISQYVICDPSGKVVLNYPAGPTSCGQNFSGPDYFQKVPRGNSYVVSADRIIQSGGSYVVPVATGISDGHNHLIGVMILNLSLAQLNAHLKAVQQQLTANGEVRIWIIDSNGDTIANTVGVSPRSSLLRRIPSLRIALRGKAGNLVAQDEQRGWLYSYVPVSGTKWAVAVGRPVDATFATAISFQHSLIIALVMLLVGASVFWFVMHGWVVAPISRLAQAVAMMRPDQTVKVTASKRLAREKSRQDEIGRLVNAFSTMEEEMHELFRKSDAQSHTRLQTLDAIMRSMYEGVLLESPSGQIVYANQRFTRFVGISAQEMLSDSFQESRLTERLEALMEAPEAYHEALASAERGDGPQVIAFWMRGYYNQFGQLVPSRRHIRMRLFEVRDMTGQLIGRGKIFNDVTQQSEAEQVKKNLLAIVSHELRTPLTSIKGYATSLLETDVELDAATQRDFLQRIVEEEDRMAELVTSLLEMSQLEAGTLKLVPDLYRLDTLIERAVKAAKSDNLPIHIALPAELPVLRVDGRRIEMVLRNILENAQRYAGDGAEVEIAMRYARDQEDEGIFLTIADNGPGLPGDLTERIFERFYQVDSGRRRGSSGVGLGLAICRGFIEAHGGRIWAENRTENGGGAIFTIWLPQRLVHVRGAQNNPFELGRAL